MDVSALLVLQVCLPHQHPIGCRSSLPKALEAVPCGCSSPSAHSAETSHPWRVSLSDSAPAQGGTEWGGTGKEQSGSTQTNGGRGR